MQVIHAYFSPSPDFIFPVTSWNLLLICIDWHSRSSVSIASALRNQRENPRPRFDFSGQLICCKNWKLSMLWKDHATAGLDPQSASFFDWALSAFDPLHWHLHCIPRELHLAPIAPQSLQYHDILSGTSFSYVLCSFVADQVTETFPCLWNDCYPCYIYIAISVMKPVVMNSMKWLLLDHLMMWLVNPRPLIIVLTCRLILPQRFNSLPDYQVIIVSHSPSLQASISFIVLFSPILYVCCLICISIFKNK